MIPDISGTAFIRLPGRRWFSILTGILLFLAISMAFSILFVAHAQNNTQNINASTGNPSLDTLISATKQAKNCRLFKRNLTRLAKTQNIIDHINSVLGDPANPRSDAVPTVAERDIAAFLHRAAHCFIQKLPVKSMPRRLSWDELSSALMRLNSTRPYQPDLSLIWMNYVRHKRERLGKLYQIPFYPSETKRDSTTPYLKYQNVLLTRGQASMWWHCQKRFSHLKPGWKAVLSSGYMSPAYQFVSFLRSSIDLNSALSRYPAPGYGGHQKRIPDMRFKLVNRTGEQTPPPWKLFYKSCAEFGIKPVSPNHSVSKGQATFVGIQHLYQTIFSNPLIPKKIARDLPKALHSSGFFPSPKGLRVILALSAQESTIQWNPKLNKQKKELLRRRFNNILAKINQSIPGSVSSFFLSEDHKEQLENLIAELHHLTDPHQEQIREYEFYLWSRKTFAFINELTGEYKQIAKVGEWFFDLQSLNSRLEKEPQTFGLWQINVNHLQEKIKSFKQLRRAFPEIYQKTGDKWIVNRSWLIDALSGRPAARLNRKRTLELIIHTHLKPHYENHMLGEKNDLMYFIAENMAGEMSTFRAAIQKELNNKMRSSLKTDGDLTFYLPYSIQIDWEKESRTFRKLHEFVNAHQYYFSKPVDPQKLIRDLCEATSWETLNQLELYQKLLDKESPVRVFPDIRSNLYHQTPIAYARQVAKKSLLF